MANIPFDVHDAWSRFHHLSQIYRLGAEGFSPSAIDVQGWKDIVSENTKDEAEIEESTDSWLMSQLMERDIARRIFKQTIVASLVAALEYSIIQMYGAFQEQRDGNRKFWPSRGVSPFAKCDFYNALQDSDVSLCSFRGYDEIKLAVQIRHAVMHRGGLLDIRESASQEKEYSELVAVLRKGWPLIPVPHGAGDELVQIEIHDAFVNQIIATCKDLVDEFHRRLSQLLDRDAEVGAGLTFQWDGKE